MKETERPEEEGEVVFFRTKRWETETPAADVPVGGKKRMFYDGGTFSKPVPDGGLPDPNPLDKSYM